MSSGIRAHAALLLAAFLIAPAAFARKADADLGNRDDLMARYTTATEVAVTQNWMRPDNAEVGFHCAVDITQAPGGDVVGVTIGSPCNADAVTRTSIEQAVMRASRL